MTGQTLVTDPNAKIDATSSASAKEEDVKVESQQDAMTGASESEIAKEPKATEVEIDVTSGASES